MPDLEELPACLTLFLPIKKVGNEVVKILLRLQNFGDFHHCVDGPPVILGPFLGFYAQALYTPLTVWEDQHRGPRCFFHVIMFMCLCFFCVKP